jgi:tetratricopeptide (TPR) repeat protein
MTATLAGTGRGRDSRFRRFLSLGAIALLALSASGCNKFKSKQLIREGNAFFKQQMYEEALKRYKEAKELDPEEVRLEKFVAMGYMALYNPGSTHQKDIDALENAVTHFKTYLAAKPEDDKAAKYLVTTYMNAQKYDEAIGYFKELFQKHPTDAQAVQTVAMLYAKKGNFEQSMEWQRKRAQLEPNNAEVFYTMGVTAWDKSYNTPVEGLDPATRKQIIDEGMANLEKADKLRTDYFEAMLYINLLYREYAKMEPDPVKKQELLDKATEWQKKALEARKRVLQKQREEQAAKNPLEAM